MPIFISNVYNSIHFLIQCLHKCAVHYSYKQGLKKTTFIYIMLTVISCLLTSHIFVCVSYYQTNIVYTRFIQYNYDLKIQLPTGTEVDVSVNGSWTHFINIVISPSPYDYGATSGLCGLFDGNRSNDRKPRPGSAQRDPNLSWR